MRLFYFLLIFLIHSSLSFAQVFETSLTISNNYKDWGWDSVYVLENGLIKTTIIPDAGGRVLEYDLSEHPSMYINENNWGFLFEDGDPWSNGGGIGGYKVWPAPQSNWGWPPPPALAWGYYQHRILENTTDSVSIFLTGPEEDEKAPGIRFERHITLYKNKSQVKVKQVIINENDTPKEWSIWDVTQSIAHHPLQTDYENFWVYFPINPNSYYGETGIRSSASSTAWRGEVAPGIYGVRFQPENKKIFADPHIGWICYVDELDSFAYAKTFNVFEGASYPDDQARVAVWINDNPAYLEVEVMSPIAALPPMGGRYTFTEDWWAAKLSGPILFVNNIGAIAEHLTIEDGQFSGRYGVFHAGTAQLTILNQLDEVIQFGQEFSVSPLETFVLNDSISISGEMVKAELRLKSTDLEYIGILDSISLAITAIAENDLTILKQFNLDQNYPNPFNPKTKIKFSIIEPALTNLTVFNSLGQKVEELVNDFKSAGNYHVEFSGLNLPGGVYFYRLQSGSFKEVKKMLLIK